MNKGRRPREGTAAHDLLPGIEAPVLVVAGEFDAFTPSWLAEKMDEALPDSELLWLEAGGTSSR